MFSFRKQLSFTYLFVILALVVALLSLFFSNILVKSLAEEERAKMEIWAMATESIATELMATNEETGLSLVLKILKSNNSIPVILYEESTGELLTHNIKLPDKDVEAFLLKKMEKFGQGHNPILLSEMGQVLYYDDSRILKQLQVYPYFQFLVIALFIGLAFFALNRSQRAVQNKLWVGLSKETAHQLGTPISSLIAWIEYLRIKNVDNGLLEEMQKDVDRLELIAGRFSKIGSSPSLVKVDLSEMVTGILSYLEKRVSGEVTFVLNFPERPQHVMMNELLFSWVIENLAKNGVDAMEGRGVLTFTITSSNAHAILDISDSGRGISKSAFKTIFLPGYTTKDRGWGLGLTLVKRIVEVNHHGKIYVKKSGFNRGTTMRIVLNLAVE